MASACHSQQTVADGIHIIQALEYADATARNSASLTPTDIGKVARQLDDDTFWLLRDDSPLTWEMIGGGTTFMPFESNSSDDTSATTTAAGFVERFSYTTPSLVAGDYLISWYFEAKNDTLNGVTRTRVQLDNTEDLAFNDVPIPLDITVDVPIAGFAIRTLSASTHDIDVDYFPFVGTTAEIRRVRINIRRVA